MCTFPWFVHTWGENCREYGKTFTTRLMVLSPTDSPSITTPVTNTTVTVEYQTTTKISISCVSTGNPPPELSWSRQTAPITCSEVINHELTVTTSFPPPNSALYDRCFINTTSPDSSELVIYNPRPEDEGTYMCTAVNTVGETMSSIYLKVQGTYINHE